jgi:hypothetical protein
MWNSTDEKNKGSTMTKPIQQDISKEWHKNASKSSAAKKDTIGLRRPLGFLISRFPDHAYQTSLHRKPFDEVR